uniref:Uncharacterized protein n=1 Tax=Sphaerodactylus townsendi TaxID=933632 RepID=A0ACB8F3H9_9SAUR
MYSGSSNRKINPEERDELKVSAKLFIAGSNSSSIREAVNMKYLQPYWAELENLVQNKKIVAIGTSDLDKAMLEQLFLWAQVKLGSKPG